MAEARANNEPIEEPPAGTDQLAADLSDEHLISDDEASAAGESDV